MANSFTNLTHTVLAAKALEAFRERLLPLTAFATDFSAEAAQRGDKVKVAYVSASDAAADFAGTYTVQDADMEGLDITIDKHKFVSWGLTDKEISTQPMLNLERFAMQKGYQLAKAVFQDVLSLVTAANYGDDEIASGTGDKLTSSATNFDSDDVIDIGTACDTDGWPDAFRSLILAPAYYGNLLKDGDLKDASASGTTGPVQRGMLPDVAGFAVHKTSLIPGNSENLVGFAAHPDAILCAMRYLAPQAGHGYANAQPLTDADTGVTIGFREWYDNDTGTMKRVLECVYGYRKGNALGIKRIESA
jgi:hypothetical protein